MAGGLVDAVLVGCDRVAANGDTANKIGTYTLAVLAGANRIPFYVVRPLSSFDPEAADGAAIEIEQRPAAEVSTLAGAQLAPEAAGVWNPAFDVTPAALITAFVTDAGVLRPPFRASIAGALAFDDGVGLQPAGGGVGGRLAAVHLQVEPGQLLGGELGADRVDQPHQRRAVGVQDLAAQDRDDVVGRLEMPVVLELDQVVALLDQVGVGGVDHADVDLARLQLRRRDIPRRLRLEALELQLVDLLEALEAQGALGHSGGPPMTSWPAIRARSLSFSRPRLRAISPVTTKPLRSTAGA